MSIDGWCSQHRDRLHEAKDARVVRLLTLEESIRKRAAAELRAMADQFKRHGTENFEVGRMRQRADELWPMPKKWKKR